MRIQNYVLAVMALFLFNTLAAKAVVTNNVASAFTGGKSFKLRGPKLRSKANPFKATIAAYNADGSLGEALDLTASSVIKKKANGFVATVTMPNVLSDLKILLSVSGGNVPENAPQQFIALLLSDPNSETNVELNNNDGSTFSSSGTTGAQGEKGDTGDTGVQGPAGPQGPQGEPGLVAINGGRVDIDPLFHLPNFNIPVTLNRSASIQNSLINVANSTFFIVTDSDPSTIDIIGNLTGAQNPGQKVTILFEAKAMVTNSEYILPNTISLHEEPSQTLALNNFKRLSLIEGTRFDNFKPGDTLVLVYDGNSWFELSRSTTFDPAFDHLRAIPE